MEQELILLKSALKEANIDRKDMYDIIINNKKN